MNRRSAGTLLAAAALVIALQPIPDAAQLEGNGDGGPATLARLDYPIGIDVDALGNTFFVEPNTSRIRRVDARTGIIDTIAGGARGNGGDGGPAIVARFMNPMDIAVDSGGKRVESLEEHGGSLVVGRGAPPTKVAPPQLHTHEPAVHHDQRAGHETSG